MSLRWNIRDLVWWCLRILNLSLLFLIAGTIGIVLGTYTGIAKMIPQVRELGDIRAGANSRVLSADGELLAVVATENRQFVPLERIPRHFVDAMVVTEDRDFYRHKGVNPKAIMRAALHDVISWGPRQGGSTITQQLARNVYLTQKKTIARKLAELILALQLERAYTKPEILELYLNQIYFGEGAYGVQVAAKTYFGKEVGELTLPECALLAGLPRRPEYYSPFENEQRSVERRNLVLAMMQERGFLDRLQKAEAQQAPLKLSKSRKPLGLSNYQAPYFTNYVLREVVRKYGQDAVYRGSLIIHTTLNLEMQKAAEEAVKYGIQLGRNKNVKRLALVAMDIHTGAIKAMVGGADWNKQQYNYAVQGGRQAGSSFKPFVYTAALEQGYTPESIVVDSPVSYPGATRGERWRPKNYDSIYHGRVTFRTALARSYNVSAVKVAEKIGIGSVIATAERMGIWHPMQPYLPLAIGYSDVNPLEMASAFAVFAAGGMRTEPYAIQEIKDARGRTVEKAISHTWRVLDERVAEMMVSMLEDVIKRGTAARIKRMLPFRAAGKTGTSNDYKDAWFIGFTDDVSAAVWSGNDVPSPMKGVAGATIPAPVWARFMVKAQPIMIAARTREQEQRVIELKPEDEDSLETPKAIKTAKRKEQNQDQTDKSESLGPSAIVTKEICPSSGLLKGRSCPYGVSVTYNLDSGDQPPQKICDVHTDTEAQEAQEPEALPTPEPRPERTSRSSRGITLPICAISGDLANAFCPLVVNRTFTTDKAPTKTCTRHGRRATGP